MLNNSKLPLLPGHVIPQKRKSVALTQNWNVICGTPVFVEKEHSHLLSESRDKIFTKSTLYPPNSESMKPDWLTYDRKILCFNGYARMNSESGGERIRQAKILFYLEDGSVQVIEPRAENSGLSQGCIVSRQQVPVTGTDGRECLSILDFNVQHVVNIFGVDYVLVDCDKYTRKFLQRAGIEVPAAIEMPPDRAQELRKRMDEASQPKRPAIPKEVHNKLEKFLLFDSKVLKFDAIWDDRKSKFGWVRELILYYYLVDDTIQISSVEAPKKFLGRQRLPKHFEGVPMLGSQNNITVLNVLGGGFMSGRFLADRQGVGASKTEYVMDSDLNIGTELNVFGRTIKLVDCDAFTREHYRKKFGIEEMVSIAEPSAACSRWAYNDNVERQLPPFNGWGSHIDSEGNCKAIESKAPLADYQKLLKYGNARLRFGAILSSDVSANAQRSFIIAYYLSDDTISVYETDERNSGFRKCEFYSRRKFYLPNQDWFGRERPQEYLSHHLFIGANVCLQDFHFHLTSADEFTLQHMESRPFEYPMANIELIMQKIRTAVEPKYKEFVARYVYESSNAPTASNGTFICFATMRNALVDLLGTSMTDHEIVSFLRYFAVGANSSGRCSRSVIRSLVHLELNRGLWNDMARLREHIYHLHPNNLNGYLPVNEVDTIVKACRLPIQQDLITKMLAVLKRNDADEIDVQDFLYFIDYLKDKAPPIQPANLFELCDKDFHNVSRLVDWNRFIEKLDLEETLKRQTD